MYGYENLFKLPLMKSFKTLIFFGEWFFLITAKYSSFNNILCDSQLSKRFSSVSLSVGVKNVNCLHKNS